VVLKPSSPLLLLLLLLTAVKLMLDPVASNFGNMTLQGSF